VSSRTSSAPASARTRVCGHRERSSCSRRSAGGLEDALTSLSIFHRLRESEKRYRHIFESTGVSIWEGDFSRVKAAIDDLGSSGVRDFRAYFAAHPQFVQDAIAMVKVVDVNAVSIKLFAAESKAELLASLDRITVAETCEVFIEQLVAIAEGRTLFEAETVLQTLKGELLTVLCTITFPTSSAGFDSVLATVMNITERKRAEYLTGQMFEGSPDSIAIVGRDYRYRRVNPVHERIWGLPRETIVGMHLAEVLSVEFFEERAKPKLDRCFAGEEVAGGGWISPQSGARYMVTTFSPLRPDSERVEAALVIGHDITEYVQAEEALQQAQADLAHVTRVATLGELAASIAHEVNQPLAAIVADAAASLNWLAAPPPDLERVREALEGIAADGHRAAEVIQRIRQLAKKSVPRKDPVNLNDVVCDVLPLARAELRHHDVSLVLQLAPELPAVLADRVQLQQVILNLVMNAIEAMGSVTGRPRDLIIRAEPHDRDHVRVTVQDTGVGIDPNTVDKLFGAFFTTKPGGMGMGLSISRSIVEAHGGRLWATSNETHGATFGIDLPGGDAGGSLGV
jgi:PAS domain S-box-containing protein